MCPSRIAAGLNIVLLSIPLLSTLGGCSTADAPHEQVTEAPIPTTPASPSAVKETGPVDANSSEEFTTTASGLKYRILRKSEGKKPTKADTVTVHYKGWLDDGTEFDSSYGRGEPATFPLGQVVPGWTEGLQLVGEGGEIELEIPSELGYGARGTPGGPIPPNATLHFTVELIRIR
jgi:FKBP-type peptidyl-prolyl cis-trans isomerase FkpA